MDEVGVDAARWYLVNRGPDQTIEIDVDLAAERSEKNPVYYVQYAHARIAGILRNAGDARSRRSRAGAARARGAGAASSACADFPLVAAEATERRGPQAIPIYAIRVADDFHRFYHEQRVLESEAQAFRLGALPRDAERDRALPRSRRGRGARADVGSAPMAQASVEPGRTGNRPDRNLALELVRVTEAAALGAGRWVGRGDKEAADQAAVDAMRAMLDTVSMDGVVVIGEGEKDEAPMLYNGEEVGDGNGPQVDVAVDPARGHAPDGARASRTRSP